MKQTKPHAAALMALECRAGEMSQFKDSVCECGHWYEEHDGGWICDAPDCECSIFVHSEYENQPHVIAERGGSHPQDCECSLCRWEKGGKA